jgi:tRNA(fMet)-specific endonuclease VapC
MNYLLDTNICIYIIKKSPEQVIKKLEAIVNSEGKNEIYLSSVTVSELYYGVHKSNQVEKNLEALNGFLTPFQVTDFDLKSAEIYGEIRPVLERAGNVIGPYDLQIASIAIAHDYILVTNNTKEFKRIKQLTLENWV